MRSPIAARLWPLLLVCLVAPAAATAQGVSAAPLADAPPAPLAASVITTLAASGARVTAGPIVLDFWWVAALPAGTTAWSQLPDGTLLGALRVSGPFRDIRGRTIKPGVYTLRYALQPQDGAHMGVSPHREFLLASPADVDVDPQPAGYQRAVDLARRTIGGSHPAVIALDPPTATDAPLAVHDAGSGLTSVVFAVPAAGGALRFGVVVIGRIEA